MDTFIPAVLMTYLETYHQYLSKPNYQYFQGFLLALLIVEGRRTVTKIAEVCFFLDRHISSFEGFLSRNQWDLGQVKEATVKLLIERLGDNFKVWGAYLVGIDTTHIPKTSKKMIGSQRWEESKGSIEGHHWGIAGLIGQFGERFLFFPIAMRLISGSHNPCGFSAGEEGIRRINFWDCALATVLEMSSLLSGKIRVVADAYFSKAPFLLPLRERGIEVITRLRRDAVAWERAVYKGRGRPPKRGKKYKLADLVKLFPLEKVSVTLYGSRGDLSVVCRDMFIRGVSKLVRIVVIRAQCPIILLSTDLSLTAGEIIELYSSRFSQEIAIRELKHSLGLMDYQCYKTIAFHRFVHLCCVAYCIFKVILIEDHNWLRLNSPFLSETKLSLRRLRRALRTFLLKRIIFSHFTPGAELEKSDDISQKILRVAA